LTAQNEQLASSATQDEAKNKRFELDCLKKYQERLDELNDIASVEETARVVLALMASGQQQQQ
jgi:hypothetical protein